MMPRRKYLAMPYLIDEAEYPTTETVQAEVATRNPSTQYQNEGVNIATRGGISTVNFIGESVSAQQGNPGTLDVTITGGVGRTDWGDIAGTLSNQTDLQTALNGKQGTLVSGTSIKTVNGSTLLGSGNLVVSGASAWGEITGTLANQTDLQTALNTKANTASLGTLATQNGTFSGTSSGTNTGDNATNTQYSGLAASKQDVLVSGTSIKTVNGTTLLGSGNLVTTQTSVTGNAGTATALETARTINGVSFNGSANIVAGQYARVSGSNVTRTAQTLADITGLSIALLANSVYDVQVCLSVACSSTAGNGYALAYSAAGASVEGQISGTLAAATQKTVRVASFAASQTFVTVAANGGIWIQAIVTTGADAGNLSAQHLKVTSGTSTVYINSYIRAIKIA